MPSSPPQARGTRRRGLGDGRKYDPTTAGAWDTDTSQRKKKEIGSVLIISLRLLCALRVRDDGGTLPDLRHYFSRITSNREGTKNTKEEQKKPSCSLSLRGWFSSYSGRRL